MNWRKDISYYAYGGDGLWPLVKLTISKRIALWNVYVYGRARCPCEVSREGHASTLQEAKALAEKFYTQVVEDLAKPCPVEARAQQT